MPVQWSNYKGGEGEGGWEVEDDLDLPEDLTSGDLMTSGSGQGEEDYFVPSPRGWCVCVVNFVPYRNLYLSSFTHSCTSYLTLPTLPSLFTYPAPNCLTTANVKEHLPVLSLKLAALMDTHSHSSWHLLWTDSW
ncbi:hypothetical protein Pmani_000065 [Petrolisthes manimaculis]|uniref:Coatomer alpha subunit C-terminal domain-containing protein n=1 Tax=Petrolisthes manimaculis TaxID=1843537 RepID=A0AAE1QN56_9EUCA|nr:hypothetical protein Pmani_000065 [Petrolisthes manimaculis]